MKRLLIAFGGAFLSILGGYPAFSAPTDLTAQIGAQYGLATVDTVNPQAAYIGPFGGLNTRDSPAIIGASQAQDMLNVDITPGGRSVKKREGFGLDTTFEYSTSPVHGVYKFFDANGNEVRLVGHDLGLYASVSGASWVRVATGTLAATWQCTDWLGQAYCVTSARDTPVRTNGVVSGTTYQSTIPAGMLIASTADRLLVGNTATNPSRLYYSGSTNFVDFTLGVLPTSSSFEDITAPGSQLTHLAYQYGNWLWWKDQSFGYITGTGQTDLNIVTVSNTIGTYDNTDIFWQGMDYFRGSDQHIYAYDGAVLTNLTRDITPTVTSANRRKANSWTQTSQTDFQGGVSTPAANISLTVSPGDVTVSSFVANEYSNTQWNSGTSSNFAIGTSNLSLLTADGNIPNNGFESGSANWTLSNGTVQAASTVGVNCTLAARSGTHFLENDVANEGSGATYKASLQICASGTEINNVTWAEADNSCSYTQRTLSSSGATAKSVKIAITDTTSAATVATSDCFLNSGTNITFYTASDLTRLSVPVLRSMVFDDITSGSDTITSGYYTSPVYNTGFASSTFQLQGIWTVSTSTPVFSLLTSTGSTGPWTSLTTSTGTNGIGNKFAIYTTTISVIQGQDALTSISSFTILSRSTGTYYSAVNNAPNLTSWSTFGANDSTPGNSAITYYVRTATGSFAVGSSTVAWVQQTKNATVNYSTGTYFQLRADFGITAATETPTLSDFTFSWYEGTASDKMYGIYFDYGLWFSLSVGSTTSNNNRVLRYDLINQIWTIYDTPSNGFLTYNNRLYFGSPTVGKLYEFGGGLTSDDNVAINSFWKSKDFFGASPFLDEDMRTLSWYVKQSSGTTLAITYTTNGQTSTSYNLNLYSPTTQFIRNNRNFPAGTQVNTINFKFGDNSTNPLWEVFAGGYTYVPRPWNATNP